METLKRLVIAADEAVDIIDFFQAHFASQPGFVMLGKALPPSNAAYQMVFDVVVNAVNTALDKPDRIREFLLIDMRVEEFHHGACRVGNYFFNYVYFADLYAGALKIVPLPESENEEAIQYSRFTTTPPPKKMAPMAGTLGLSKKKGKN